MYIITDTSKNIEVLERKEGSCKGYCILNSLGGFKCYLKIFCGGGAVAAHQVEEHGTLVERDQALLMF